MNSSFDPGDSPTAETPTLLSRAARPARSYRGTLVLVALMAAGLTILALVVTQAVTLVEQAQRLGAIQLGSLALLISLPIAASLVSFALAAQAIHLLRITIYLNSLHEWTTDWLHHHAPLYHLRQAGLPLVTPADHRGIPDGTSHQNLRELCQRGTTALLVGPAGSGKSVALVGIAHEFSRRDLAVKIWLGLSPLPVLISAFGLVSADDAGFPPITYCAREVARHASPGFSRYFPLFMRRRRALILCDGLHQIDEQRRADVCELLAKLLRRSNGRAAAIAACDPASHLISFGEEPALATWSRLLVDPMRLPLGALVSADALGAHLLGETLTIPALGVALTDLPSAETLPWGVPHLMVAWRGVRWGAQPAEAPVDQAEQVLARLAATMLQAHSHCVPVEPGEAPGEALHRWMAEHRTLQPARVRRSVPLQLSEELTQQVLSAAITADILRLAVDGRSISFAHGIITASYAADWLIAQDDETLPLDGILLRPMIAPAFMHWAGRIERPFTLGQRALGLRRGSTTVARQASLGEQVPVNNAALALATLATCTGVAIRLAYARREGGNPAQAIVGSEAFMRDILDETQQTLTDPQEARAFLQPLRTLRSYLGQDTDAAINALATEPQLSRLTRAQLFNLLGALATPAALTMLAASLPESDPTLRAGVNRGFELAGSAAIHFLQEEMNSGDARISARAREVLVGLGNTSIAASPTALYTTLRTLSTVSGPERAASIQALGAINSPEAHDALVGALDDDDSQVRAAAVTALAQRRDPISLPLLRARVTMPDPQMRAALAQGLANYTYPEQLSDLSALLADTDGRVRTAAARSLGMVGDERAIPLLDQHRADPDPRTQVTVLAALRRLRGG